MRLLKTTVPITMVAWHSSGVYSFVPSVNSSRQLSFELIAGYEPSTQVTDQNVIDLDQAAIVQELAFNTAESFEIAQQIYQQGGNSKSIARVVLALPLPVDIQEGTELIATSINGGEVVGSALMDVAAGSLIMDFRYPTSDLQANHGNCRVGGLAEPILAGCLASTGIMRFGGLDVGYSYEPTIDNLNGRTIQGFSTSARQKMWECQNCPYTDYEKFVDYYGVFDYANQWIMSAFSGSSTSFDSGNVDFDSYGLTGRAEAIRGGTVYMALWMYVLRQLEDAVDDCQQDCLLCNDDPAHSWDVAVAYYTGSLEGQDGSGDGNLLYALADKHCTNFRTCGEDGTNTEGMSKVNSDIFLQFNLGQVNLLSGNCSAGRENKNQIARLLTIPLVQGSLRFAYLSSQEFSNEQVAAAGAVFAASVLPIVHYCSETDAETIFLNMSGGSGPPDFALVKEAFERNYACMGITCSDVGGLVDQSSGTYFAGVEPCSDQNSETPSVSPSVTTSLLPTVVATDSPVSQLISEAPSASPSTSLIPTVLTPLPPSASPSTTSQMPTTLSSTSPSKSLNPTVATNPTPSPTAPLVTCTECTCNLCAQNGGILRPNNGTVVVMNSADSASAAATCDLWAIVACSSTSGTSCEELQTGVVADSCCLANRAAIDTQGNSSGSSTTTVSAMSTLLIMTVATYSLLF